MKNIDIENENIKALAEKSGTALKEKRWIEALLIESILIEFFLENIVNTYRESMNLILDYYGMTTVKTITERSRTSLGDLCGSAHVVTKNEIFRNEHGAVSKLIKIRNDVTHGLVSSHEISNLEKRVEQWFIDFPNIITEIIEENKKILNLATNNVKYTKKITKEELREIVIEIFEGDTQKTLPNAGHVSENLLDFTKGKLPSLQVDEMERGKFIDKMRKLAAEEPED